MTTPVGAVAGNAEEAQRDARGREVKGGSVFSRKYGPLPGWGWAALAGVAAIGYFWWRNRSSAQAAGTDTSATDTSGTNTSGSGAPDDAAALQEEIDALQGQLATDTQADTADAKADKEDKDRITVPKVTGLRVNTAIAKLRTAGFRHKLSEQRKPGVAYKVKSQSPEAGSKHDPGTTVELHIERDHPDRDRR